MTKEPGFFESMALVHARIRRVVFCNDNEGGGLSGSSSEASIHALPSTNHRYRAFRCVKDNKNDIYVECKQLMNLCLREICSRIKIK